MDFNSAFDVLLGNEGALSMDEKDRGNWTGGQVGLGQLRGSKYGISAAAFPNLDITHLTIEDARSIYRVNYWARAGCESVPDVLKFDLFDMAVNSGVRAAVMALQDAVGSAADGILGNDTVMHVQSMPEARLLARFNAARLHHLTSMAADIWASQGRGLVNRVANNLMRA